MRLWSCVRHLGHFAYSGKSAKLHYIQRLLGKLWISIIVMQKAYNMTLPDWVTPEVFQHMEKLSDLFFDSRVLVPNEEAKRVKAGPLIKFLVNNMELKLQSKNVAKMYALSGHDTTSSIALGAVGVFDTQFPSYASAAIFEMHKINNDHVVRVRRIWFAECYDLLGYLGH